MEFKINIISEDENFALEQAKDLKNWIEDDEEIDDIDVKQQRAELGEDDAGGALLAGIKILLGSPFEHFATTLQVWLQERTKRKISNFNLEIEAPNGKKIKLDAANLQDTDKDFIRELTKQISEDKKEIESKEPRKEQPKDDLLSE